MRHVQLIGLAMLLIAAPRLEAQRPASQRNDAGSKDAVRRPASAVHPDIVSHCQNILRLQSSALEAANRVERLSRAPGLKRAVVQAQAETSRSDLQSLLKELDATLSSADAEQKAVIASLLVHDREAAQHADQMVTTAQNPSSAGSDIATHASAVIDHVKQAQYALKTDPNTGQPTGRRGTMLCATPGAVIRSPTPGKAPALHTGQATGKRQ